MRRRLYSFVTALVCLCALLPAAFAASDSPTPPGWIPEKIYDPVVDWGTDWMNNWGV